MHVIAFISLLLPAATVLVPGQAVAQAGSTLFTTYNFSPSEFTWLTCGSTSVSEGCYGSGTVSGFGNACAILSDGVTGISTKFEQRIYVLDKNATGKNDAVLHVLTRQVYVDGSGFAHTKFTKAKDVSLPLTGGNGVRCFASDNAAIIATGTSKSTEAAIVNKSSLVASSYGGFSPPADMIGITTDASGYITLNFDGGFYLLGPDGSLQEDGGGNAYLIPLHNAITP
jgi:hypothetical protein